MGIIEDAKKKCTPTEVAVVEESNRKSSYMQDIMNKCIEKAFDKVEETLHDTMNGDVAESRENKLLMIRTNGIWLTMGKKIKDLTDSAHEFETMLNKSIKKSPFDKSSEIISSIYSDMLVGLTLKYFMEHSEEINTIIRGE